MSRILAIESSAGLCSLALSCDGTVYSRQQQGQRSHTQYMLSFVDELLQEAGITLTQLDAISFSAGPGSFTGIRLAASTAKALAFAANIPVIAVSSLAIMAQGFYRQLQRDEAVAVITDARMDELYVGQYRWHNGLAEAVADDALLKLSDAPSLPLDKPVIGDAEPLLKLMHGFSTLEYIAIEAHALDLLPLAAAQLSAGDVTTAMDAEAIYLRGKSGWKTTAQQLAEKAQKQ